MNAVTLWLRRIKNNACLYHRATCELHIYGIGRPHSPPPEQLTIQHLTGTEKELAMSPGSVVKYYPISHLTLGKQDDEALQLPCNATSFCKSTSPLCSFAGE